MTLVCFRFFVFFYSVLPFNCILKDTWISCLGIYKESSYLISKECYEHYYQDFIIKV